MPRSCEVLTSALKQVKTQATGSACSGVIDVHEVVQAPATGSAGGTSVYVAEIRVTEAAKSSAGSAAAMRASAPVHYNTAYPHQHPASMQLPMAQPPHHTQQPLDYAHAFLPHNSQRRVLGLGFSDHSAATAAAPANMPVNMAAPVTWQSAHMPFAPFDGGASLAPWSWGEGGQ